MVHLITTAAVTTREENKNHGHVPKILGRDFFVKNDQNRVIFSTTFFNRYLKKY